MPIYSLFEIDEHNLEFKMAKAACLIFSPSNITDDFGKLQFLQCRYTHHCHGLTSVSFVSYLFVYLQQKLLFHGSELIALYIMK